MDDKAFLDWLSSYTDPSLCLEAFRNQKQFFRVNTIKAGVGDFTARTKLKCARTPYHETAFELQERPAFQIGRTWEYFLGIIHPQSMPSILASLALAPKPGETVLDVASAPGSKFSHMAALMENRGVLVGNDLKGEKVSALYSTINRLNVLNCIITTMDGSRLPWKARFDKVLLDAPCTALGSGAGAGARWEPDHSTKISILQKRMAHAAFEALKTGGEMVYSTCTYAKEENEDVVRSLLENAPGAQLVESGLAVPCDGGLSEYGGEFRKCMRIYPQHLRSEGFFISKIRKGE
jgi:NOL1/NOP2/sun family putative RNA methylase